jgi:hypothetical protein
VERTGMTEPMDWQTKEAEWLSDHLLFCPYNVFGVENFYSDIFVIELLIFLLLLFLPVILSISVFYLYQSEHAKSLPDLNRNLTNTIELGTDTIC